MTSIRTNMVRHLSKKYVSKIQHKNMKIEKKKMVCVGSRFVADRNSVGFARKTALTISFVERGFERLGLDR